MTEVRNQDSASGGQVVGSEAEKVSIAKASAMGNGSNPTPANQGQEGGWGTPIWLRSRLQPTLRMQGRKRGKKDDEKGRE